MILVIKNFHYVGTCVNCYLIYVFFMPIAFRICNHFSLLFLYIIILLSCEKLPYIGRCKLVSAIVIFYN